MENNEYLFPVRGLNDHDHVTLEKVSETCYRELIRETWRTRKYMQYQGWCCVPGGMRWMCDGECDLCRFRKEGPMCSLEALEERMGHEFQHDGPDMESVVADRDAYGAVIERLRELAPDAVRSGELQLQGMSACAAARELGTSAPLIRYHLKKALREIQKEGLLEDISFLPERLLSI